MSKQRRVIIVTGANNGLGYHLSKALLKKGHYVAGLDIETDHMIAIQEAYPHQFMASKCDVTCEKSVNRAVDSIIDKWKNIDVLVNNACLAIFKRFEEKAIKDTMEEFNVNYFGYVRMIKAILPHMRRQGYGLIHNTGSGIGITGFDGIYGYASTKAAIETLTRTLSIELEGTGIKVNIIQPPLMYTKSAAPLNIPVQMMETPEKTAERFAEIIMSTKPVMTHNLSAAFLLYFFRMFPNIIGRFLSNTTAKERKKNQNKDRNNKVAL